MTGRIVTTVQYVGVDLLFDWVRVAAFVGSVIEMNQVSSGQHIETKSGNGRHYTFSPGLANILVVDAFQTQ